MEQKALLQAEKRSGASVSLKGTARHREEFRASGQPRKEGNTEKEAGSLSIEFQGRLFTCSTLKNVIPLTSSFR